MPRIPPDDRPLEQGPDTFDAVGVHVADYPFLFGVVDGLVPRVGVGDAQIGLQLVTAWPDDLAHA